MAAIRRRPVFYNNHAPALALPAPTSKSVIADSIVRFHHKLLGLEQTPLIALGTVAKDLGFRHVFVKDETRRFGSSPHSTLGVSWAVFRSLTERLDLPLDIDLQSLKSRLHQEHITIYVAAEGDFGLAIARASAALHVPINIYVAGEAGQDYSRKLRAEGAIVTTVNGSNFAAAASIAKEAASQADGLLLTKDLLDLWIGDGNFTIWHEIRQKLSETQCDVDLLILPVEDGLLGYSAVNHFKSASDSPKLLTVESDSAACLWKSLATGEPFDESKHSVAIPGPYRGKLSPSAWPRLRDGIDAALTVSGFEAHELVKLLQQDGIETALKGASGLAGLHRLRKSDFERLGLNTESVIVLICTEPSHTYATPKDVSSNDLVGLTQAMVQIDSASPDLGSIVGPGEMALASYVDQWLQHRDIETHWIEYTQGRPSVVGRVSGSGGGKSLMFNGHLDTVTLLGYDGDPLSGNFVDGKIFGRGSADMKSGLAATMIALATAKTLDLAGDVILAAVADEESLSIGTEDVLRAGWRADAAIIPEPTEMAIINHHRGFSLFEVDIYGVASHGSRPDLGVDAISKAGYFLVELDRLSKIHNDPTAGLPFVHVGLIKGGEEICSYPAVCTISIDTRPIDGQTTDMVENTLRDILERLSATVPEFKFGIRRIFSRSPHSISLEHPFVELVIKHATESMGISPVVRGETYWTDMALLAEAGIPGVIWGPRGFGLHSKHEWVEVESSLQLLKSLIAIETEFCRLP